MLTPFLIKRKRSLEAVTFFVGGQMKEFAERFYKSKQWQNTRNAYVRYIGGLCEECYKKGKIVPVEEVHHIIPLTAENINDPNITVNWDNLIGLCRECHRQMHSGRERRYSVDEFGRVTIT